MELQIKKQKPGLKNYRRLTGPQGPGAGVFHLY
jgi:hypothetical protein